MNVGRGSKPPTEGRHATSISTGEHTQVCNQKHRRTSPTDSPEEKLHQLWTNIVVGLAALASHRMIDAPTAASSSPVRLLLPAGVDLPLPGAASFKHLVDDKDEEAAIRRSAALLLSPAKEVEPRPSLRRRLRHRPTRRPMRKQSHEHQL